jgi:hypothetical protein
LAALLSTSGLSFGTPVFAKKEAKPCATCHEKGKATKENQLLNAAGKYYKEKKTLVGAPK